MSLNPPEGDLVVRQLSPHAGDSQDAGGVLARETPWQQVGRTFVQNRLAVIGVVLIILLILFSFIGPLIHPTDQLDPNLEIVNSGPTGSHLLGTDNSGFDVLGRLMYGGRSSLIVGLSVGVASTVFGLVYGAISGYFGGMLDGILMRIVDVGLAIPVIFLFIFVAEIFKPDLTLLIVLLVAVSWLVPARLVRGESLSLRTRAYVQAVTAMGGGSGRVIFRHLIPNTMGTIAVTATLQVANAILTLALLQYLNFGLPPTDPTWGSMLSNGVQYLQDGYWWEVYPALVIIVITVLALNFIGDALQDAFDVRLQPR